MHLFKTNQKIFLRRHSGPIWFLIATKKLSTDLKQMCWFNFRAKPENNWKLCSLLFFIHIRIGQFLIWVLWILIEIQPFHLESFLFKTILRNPKKNIRRLRILTQSSYKSNFKDYSWQDNYKSKNEPSISDNMLRIIIFLRRCFNLNMKSNLSFPLIHTVMNAFGLAIRIWKLNYNKLELNYIKVYQKSTKFLAKYFLIITT